MKTTSKARKALETALWKRTHKDYKGGRGDERSILILDRGVTKSVRLADLSDAKLRAMLGVGGFKEEWHERSRGVRRTARIVGG